MIVTIRLGLKQDEFDVSLCKLCRWLEIPCRTTYYKPTNAPANVQDRYVQPINRLNESNPSFGYRTVAHLLDFNKNTVQRIFQLKGPQVRKRPVGMRPRVKEPTSVAERPNERWAPICAAYFRLISP
jgi:putative transposase